MKEEEVGVSELELLIVSALLEHKFEKIKRQNLIFVTIITPIYPILATVLSFPVILTLFATIIIYKVLCKITDKRMDKFIAKAKEILNQYKLDKSEEE